MKTPWIIIALAVAVAQNETRAANGAELPPIREAVFFGDSLTDAGTYGFRFTTGSGWTWAQHVAEHYGQSTAPNEHVNRYADVYRGIHGLPGPGGLNYAEGGARVALPYSQVSTDREGTPIPVEVQLRHFLMQHGTFHTDQVVFLYIGTNDVAFDYDPQNAPTLAAELRNDVTPRVKAMQLERARIRQAADHAVQIVRRILQAGARRLVVFELPDLGEFPWFHTRASQAFVTELSNVYNRRLSAGLPPDSRLLTIHMQDYLNDLADHAPEYALTHRIHDDACKIPDQDFCAAAAFSEPDADQTYIAAAAEHLSTRAHELLASYVLRKIDDHSW